MMEIVNIRQDHTQKLGNFLDFEQMRYLSAEMHMNRAAVWAVYEKEEVVMMAVVRLDGDILDGGAIARLRIRAEGKNKTFRGAPSKKLVVLAKDWVGSRAKYMTIDTNAFMPSMDTEEQTIHRMEL